MPTANDLYCSEYKGERSFGPPVLLLHGAGGDRLSWPRAFRRLAGYRILTVDLAGHGRSSDGLGLQSIDAHVEKLFGFLNELGIYRAIMVGYSMGGAIALKAAFRQPERVAALGLISTSAAINVPAHILNLLSQPLTLNDACQKLSTLLFSDHTPPAVQQKTIKTLRTLRHGVLYSDWLACSRFDMCTDIPVVNTPAWVAAGANDRLTPPSQSRYLARHLPNATLKIVPNAGHLATLEATQTLSQGLKAFLDKLNCG